MMAGFCDTPLDDLGLVRGLLTNVDCNVNAVGQLGYSAVSGSGSQLAFALTTLMTIYVAVFGLRMLLGMAPLRIGDLTVTALKLGLVLALVTSWQAYQVLVFNTLFRGPEQLAASVMNAIQPAGSALRGNPFDGLQIVYDQFQAAAAFFVRVSPPAISPFTGGVSFAAFSLNFSAFLALFTTLGAVLAAKIVLGILLALGPVFIAFLLFDSTRGVFEGWLRAALTFAFIPLFATLALSVQLTLIEPQLLALSDMTSSGKPNLQAASAAFVLTMISAAVSIAGMAGIFVVALGFKLRWNGARTYSAQTNGRTQPGAAPMGAAMEAAGPSSSRLPRISSISAAAVSMERRDQRFEGAEAPRRLMLGAQIGSEGEAQNTAAAHQSRYRRSAQPRRAASSARRDR